MKEEIRKAMRTRGLLPSDDDLRAQAEALQFVSSVTANLRGASTSDLILCLLPPVLANAWLGIVDNKEDAQEWMKRVMTEVTGEIDRRIPVPS